MKILFVTARLPYPLLKGDQVRGYHHLRLLSNHHEITLFSFANLTPKAEQEAKALKPFCQEIITVPLERTSQFLSCMAGATSDVPFQTLLYQSREMRAQLHKALQQSHFDIVHVQLARMAPYFEKNTHIPRVIDLIDALSVNMRRRKELQRGPIKLLLQIEQNRMKHYERRICNTYDQALVVSKEDRDAIGQYDNLHVNPIGIDWAKITKSLDHPKQNLRPRLSFSGNMSYFPNVNAIKWFVNNVWPLIKAKIPSIELSIIGTNPHISLYGLAKEDPSIIITGHVDNIYDHIAQSDIAIAPMQSGSGMQFKVIEAMALNVPLVVTPYAIGGLPVKHECELLIATTPDTFAHEVCRLLTDPNLRLRLSQSAMQLVQRTFTWEKSVQAIEDIYQQAIDSRKAKSERGS